MTDTRASSIRPRFAIALAVLLALGGAMGIAQAQSGSDAVTSLESSTSSTALAFAPSSEARFAEAFANFSAPDAAPAIPAYAVDISTIEPAAPPTPRAVRSLGRGVASYYGRQFHGRLTANGERFDMNAMTAAHKTLPFGTRLRVTNPSNGRSVIVRVNDRGPFIAGREIDLAQGAAERIGLIQRGHGTVELEVVE